MVKEAESVAQIYEEECAAMMLSFAAIAIVPSEREMSKMLNFLNLLNLTSISCVYLDSSLNKARRAITPLIPTTQLFAIPEPYNKTLRNHEFIVVDKMITRRQRILLFVPNEQF